MKISIIIPVYNVSKYIERCLLSALNQTWPDLEIILVDDCTPDDSVEVAEKVLAEHPRKEIVKILRHEKNKGQSAARNTGIREAQGEAIYFLDSDDYLPLNSLSLLADIYTNSDYDFVIGNYEIKGKERAIPPLNLKTGELVSKDTILSAYAYHLWPRTVWNILIGRAFILEKELFFEEGIIHEDDLWTFKLACTANKAYVLNAITYYYYIHVHSTTGSPSVWNLECRVQIISLMYDYIMTSEELMRNKYVYLIFEKTKVKYFDRILYFLKDDLFYYNSYLKFRYSKYKSPLGILSKVCFFDSMTVVNFHYRLPEKIGYLYFKMFVKLSYLYLLFSLRLKKLFIKK